MPDECQCAMANDALATLSARQPGLRERAKPHRFWCNLSSRSLHAVKAKTTFITQPCQTAGSALSLVRNRPRSKWQLCGFAGA